MANFIIRRLTASLVTLFFITCFVYFLIRSMPGTPAMMELAMLDPSRKISKEDYERMEKAYGLDKPWHQAYFHWLGNLGRLDLANSFYFKEPVTKVIRVRLWPTFLLSSISLALSYLLSIPMGLYCTARRGGVDERSLSTFLYMLYSFPAFVAALFLQIIFAVRWEWLPLFEMYGPGFDNLPFWGKVWDLFLHSLMPVICYTYGSLAYYTRFVRSNMLEVMQQDYIRTARAKGVGPMRVLFHHAFRNTLIPMVTMLGLTLPALLGGSVILEQIFTWPGMGRLFMESLSSRDYPVIMGLVLMYSVLTLLGTLLADLLYAVVDPRVSYS